MEKRRFWIFAVLVLGVALLSIACSSGGGGGGGGSATLVSIAVAPADPSVALGKTRQLTATGAYSDGSTKDLTASATWTSSDEARATVSAGLVTTVSIGRTTITASSGGVSGSAIVAVSAVTLPRTGQIVSYATGSVGDDGALKMGVAWPEPRFTVGAGAEVDCVTDNLTGLIWVKAPDSTTRTWQAALDYAEGLTHCGHADWRLPNRKELRSLANYGQGNVATWLNTQGFSNVQADLYWSSTTYAGNTTDAWFVSMVDGYVLLDLKTVNYYVWPVRSGQ